MDTDTSFLRVRAVKTLSNLSLTCRQLRRACLPTLLRRCRILVRFNHTSRQHFDLQVASRISPYVQCLRLMIKEPPTRAMHESLRSLVLCFPRLRTLLITECHAGLSLAVVDALLSCATPIEEFVLENVVWDYDPPYNATVAPIVAPLKKYIEHQRNIGHRIDLRGHTDTYMTFFRLDLLRQFLASHTWNSMQELILYRGSSVVEDGTLFLPVLRAMPKLRVVKIFLPTDHYRQPRLEICPPEEARSMSITPLREVTIANVAPTDHFFGLLPDDLMVLSIRETPRYYFSRDWWPTYLATPAEFAALFRSRTFTQLQHLEMAFAVVSDDTFDEEQSLYDAMVHSCPNVRSLEVHRYHAPQNSPSLVRLSSPLYWK
ncbi:hypothetical protein K474DRAFT_569336 [Panus rudis PR-1116 ss-1]|nr:hypothetical protein K474DRAFT_569336 [Panus rudis PR-1116 ss-1]